MPKLIRLAQIVENISVSDINSKHLTINEVFVNSDNIVFLEDDLVYKKRVSQSPHWPADLDDRISITKIYFNTMLDSKDKYMHVLGDALGIAEKLGA